MDLAVEDNEVTTSENLSNLNGNEIENNGSFGGEHGDDNSLGDMRDKDVRATESVSSPLLAGTGSVGSSPLATAKGYGLKKWRRIRREFSRDGSSKVDASKILKRGLSTSMVNSSKPPGVSAELRQKSNSSVSSTNAVLRNLGVSADGFGLHSSNLDSRLVAGPSFAAGTDSDNSEDRSSKSSTAASAPRDKNRLRTLSGKNLISSVQRGQQGKSRAETSKKHRGERVKIEKENSHSSVESDSRSSNFVFMQGCNTVTSNGRQSGRSMNYDGENSDEAPGGEQHSDEDLQTGHSKENMGEFEALSQEDLAADLSWDAKEVKVENHRSPMVRDPLLESIHTLQSAQEELEKEVQKLKEIGTEYISLFDGSAQWSSSPSEFAPLDSRIHEASSSDLLHSVDITPHFLETQIANLKQNANLLEGKLEEANSMLKVKEAKIIELEHALKGSKFSKEEDKNNRQIETELEGLFKQKIEAEVEFLAIARTVEKLRVGTVDQVELFEEQKTLASEQAQILSELGDVESKAAMLKKRAKKLETNYEDVVGTEDVLKLQKGVCKVTTCFFIQLMLVLVFALFLLQLSPHYEGVVPT